MPSLQLDEVDKRLLQELQKDLPLVETPFAEVAERVGISEGELFQRARRLMDQEVIRKFGLRVDSAKVGFASTLVAMKIPPEKLEAEAEKVSAFEGVTHNYQREHEYNLWFTVIERDEERLRETLEKIREEIDYEEMLDLPVKRKFKIDVRFDIR
jgi:DNA-binding Lrp family transcriptional regulator